MGESEPWLLDTNFHDAHLTRLCYFRRAWMEELFGDLEKHGLNLAMTHLDTLLKLSHLTRAVVLLLYTWLVGSGSHSIKCGSHHIVDRAS